MRFLLDRGGPKPQGQGPCKTQKRRDMDTEEKPRGDGGRDGREAGTSPGMDAQSLQKPEEAGRTLPWSLCRELSPASAEVRDNGLPAGGPVVQTPGFQCQGCGFDP